jgi:hypothetical protein
VEVRHLVGRLALWLARGRRAHERGALRGLDLRHRGVSGGLLSVGLHGTGGVKRVSADVFRAVVNARRPSADAPIRSNWFALAPVP